MSNAPDSHHPPEDSAVPVSEPPRRVPPMVVVAFVLAVIPCCPPLGLAGSALGLLSLARIRRAGGPRRAERFATAAVLLGAGLTLLQVGALQWWRGGVLDDERLAVASAVERALAGPDPVEGSGDPAPLFEDWGPGSGVGVEEATAFASALRERFGSFVDVRLNAGVDLGNPQLQQRQWSAVVVFGNDERLATIETRRAVALGRGAWGLLPGVDVTLRRISVDVGGGAAPIEIGRPWPALDARP